MFHKVEEKYQRKRGEGHMYQTFVFDFDGTIIDSEMIGLNALQATLREVGMEKDINDLKFFLGLPGLRTLEILGVPEKEKVYKNWIAREKPLLKNVKIFPDVIDTIKLLPENSIVTSKTAMEMNNSFFLLGIESHFREVVTASDTTLHKPNPEPLQLVLKKLQRTPNEALYIGDSEHDMACAHAAGVDFGLALWGAKTREEFEKADFIFESPEEVMMLTDSN